jgi:subtilase family serine protease
MATEDAFAGKKKKTEYNQATSQANACGNDKLTLNVGCQNIGSQNSRRRKRSITNSRSSIVPIGRTIT